MTITPYALNFRHLRAVLAIGEKGSINAAAAEVNLSQPAITQGLARLEIALAQPLFDRHPAGMKPTVAGNFLLPRIALALNHIALAARAIRGNGSLNRLERLISMANIRALIAVAQTGSFVLAAQTTGLSQPALHNATRDVERLANVTLIERRGRGVVLTPEGQRLARGFRLAISELEAAISELEALRGIDSGRIAIGAMPLSRIRLLPKAVARFHTQHPMIEVAISEGAYAELIEALRDGDLDVLIGALRNPPPGNDVVQEPLFSDSLVVVAKAGHPLANTPNPTIDDLAAFPWIMSHRGTPLRAQFERLFEHSNKAPPAIRIECGSVLALRGLLLEGDFLTLLSPGQVALEVQSGLLRCISLRRLDDVRTIALTTRAGWRPTGTQQHFVNMLKKFASELNLS